MRTVATARFVRVSARKARLVLDQIRGKSVGDALQSWEFDPIGGSIFGKLNLPPPNQTQPIRSVGDGTGRARQIWFALVPLSGLESKSP